MASSLWAEAVSKGRREGRKEGRQEGRQEGAVEEAQAFCAELTRELHPDVADRIVPAIEACSDVGRLHEWGLQASRLSDAEFERLVTEEPRSGSRTPRPSRKANRKRA